MRIGIDLHAAERDGTGNCTYIRGLVRALLALDFENEYILYVIDRHHPFYKELRRDEKVVLRPLPVDNALIRIPLFLSRATYRDGVDVLHVQFVAPLFHHGKLLATIHDLGFLHVPDTFSRFFVLRSKILVRRTAVRAARIVTGSNFSKKDMIDKYKLPPEKIDVIAYGISPAFKLKKSADEIQAVLDRYHIRRPFVLSVGRLNPRKNLIALAGAFSRLEKEKKLAHQLVLTGRNDFGVDRTMEAMIKTGVEDIVLTGLVDENDLPALYQAAEIFIYPSLFEGVGLPVLEAMAAGVPVISADSSSLPEIVGEAGILIDPGREEQIEEAIWRMAADPALREDYSRKGRKRAAQFDWDLAAEKTLSAYRAISSGP